jgi:hypothetical protein
MSRRPALNLPSTRSTEHDDVQEPEAGPEEVSVPAGVVSTLTGADTSTPYDVAQLPTPYDVPETVTTPLTSQERDHLAVCEQALHAFRRSVIVAGKALDVINRGRLYRDTHGTFVEYLDDVWGIRKSHAYRMIEEWPVAAAVSPIGDINEGQARELVTAVKTYDMPTAVALYRGVKELRGERKVTAADLAEARLVLPSARTLTDPEQVPDMLRIAATEGRAPRLAPASVPEHQEPGEETADGDIGQGELNEGAEAVATMEAALAQQKQIYDRVGGGVLAAALLYDPGRGDRLRHELRQYANRTAYRMRQDGDSPQGPPAGG